MGSLTVIDQKSGTIHDIPLIRTSERKDFKRCTLKWYWNYVEGLQSTGRTANALWFGTGMHRAMEQWYIPGRKRGSFQGMLESWEEYCDGEQRRIGTLADPDFDGEARIVDARELGRVMLTEYVIEYGQDSHWEVICVEQPFQIAVPWPQQLLQAMPVLPEGPLAWYAGTFDLVVRDLVTGEIWIVDHKNVKSIDTKYLQMDDQAGSYLWVATEVLRHLGLIEPHEQLSGIIFNFLRKALPDDRPQNEHGQYLNKDGSVSKKQPPPRFHREEVERTDDERVSQGQRVQKEAIVMDQFRRGLLPIIKNPTKDCSWECPFFDMCLLEDQGGDVEEFKDALFRTRDPYADHREDMTVRSGVQLVPAEIQ